MISNKGKDDVIRISDNKQRNRESIRGLKPGGYLTREERKLCDGRPIMGGDLSSAAFIYFLFKANFAACVCSSALLLSFHLPGRIHRRILPQYSVN